MGAPRLVACTDVSSAGDGLATAAALAVALAQAEQGATVLLAELGAGPKRRPTLLSSSPARIAEQRLGALGIGPAAARGRICWVGIPLDEDWLDALAALHKGSSDAVVAHLPAPQWRRAIDDPGLPVSGALIRAYVRAQRPLLALAVADLRALGVRVRVAARPLGLVGSRRALAGLDPGGPATSRFARAARSLVPPSAGSRAPAHLGQAGQALPLVLGAAFVAVFVALVLAALGGAVTATERAQTAVDLTALSAARSLRDDLPRLVAPERLPDGSPNPAHLERGVYLRRAQAAAYDAAEHNELEVSDVRVTFPDAGSPVPVRARVALHPSDGPRSRALVAQAEAAPPAAAGPPPTASGGGYSGPLAYRQGQPMRPDVAAAFDRLSAAARRDGVALVITSAYRSDAEQARLFAANPDPRWVAPPGTSLHRCATELDLGPASAYGWLAANASRFGFLKRYSWEAWHFGYTRGPAPCSAAGNSLGGASAGDAAVGGGLPDYVPAAYHEPLARAAARWDVSVALLAAQLEAESGFNPNAVSPAGAQGIAQFMPGTAGSYGLRDPFNAPAAIDAQAHLMADLLAQFGLTQLALAAYNTGPAPVAACSCVPAIPETQAYVARILALMGGAGEAVPALEVRLVA
jgi:soluble lytic murein transglycosylase-like protein